MKLLELFFEDYLYCNRYSKIWINKQKKKTVHLR